MLLATRRSRRPSGRTRSSAGSVSATTQTTPAGAAALEAARAQLKATVPSVEIAPPAQCQPSPDFAALPGAAALLILTPSNTPAELLRGPQPAVYGAAGRGHVQLLRPSREAVSESGDATGFGPDAATAESEAGRQAAVAALAAVQAKVANAERELHHAERDTARLIFELALRDFGNSLREYVTAVPDYGVVHAQHEVAQRFYAI